MKNKLIIYLIYLALIIAIVLTAVRVTGIALGFDTTRIWAWGTNIGWVNLNPTHGGVTVYDDHLEGYAWAENVGWIRLGIYEGGGAHTYANDAANSYGVNNDGAGNLSGYAWGTNIGWVNFNPSHSQVTIDPATGEFDGYAWAENVGWISFRGAGTSNAAPAATDDGGTGFTTDEDTAITTASVLSNDSDPDGDSLAVSSFDTTGTVGLVTDNGDGTFGYNPNSQFEFLAAGETVTDTFTYTAGDWYGSTDEASVTVTIIGVNDAPLAMDDGTSTGSELGFVTDEDTAFTTASVLSNDSDPEGDNLSVVSFDTTSTLGLVTDNGDGTFDYDPNGQFEHLTPGESASDTFIYTINDGNGGTASATVTITVTGLEDGFFIYLPLVIR